jgi:RNA polymerase sigma-70 factor (ECF subfamily)
VHHSLASYQPSKGAFTTWLYRITVNHCINKKRRRRLQLLSLGQVHPAQMPRQPSPESEWGERDTVAQAIQNLSAKLRAVVVLRYYADMSYADIAQTLEIPLGTVKSRLNAALGALRVDLETSASGLLLDEEVIE